MPTQTRRFGGVHAGKTGDADTLFLKHGCVAIGWSGMGDLSKLKPDRETFKAKVAETYPDSKPGAIPTNGGQIFRFVHEMKPGDLVVYPSKRDRLIHVGVITGPYRYEPGEGYPNRRSVNWIREVPRTHFTQGALYEIGSAMSLFQVKTYAEEFRLAQEGQTAAAPPLDLKAAGIWILGKGRTRKQRLTLPAPTLKSWLEVRGRRPGPLLYSYSPANDQDQRLCTRGAYRIIRNLGAALGIHLHPHQLRHSAVTEAVEAATKAGLSLDQVRDFSRHKNIQTLLTYRDQLENKQARLAELVASSTETK